MERTLFMVKPDGVARGLVGEIVSRIERRGLSIRAMRLLRVTPEQAAELAAITGGEFEPDPAAARERAIELSGQSGAVIVCGSLYLLHDLISRPHGVEATRSSA